MSTLQERLDRIRERFLAAAPAQAKEVMGRAAEELRASGILAGLPQVGQALPAFELADTGGQLVDSRSLLAEGPLVITFYRGVW